MKLIYRLILYFLIDAAVFAFAFMFYPQAVKTAVAVYMVTYCLVFLLLNAVFFQVEYAVFLKGLKKLSDTQNRFVRGDHAARVDGPFHDRYIKDISEGFNAVAAAFGTLEKSTESFIANTSHELRSPLASIQGFLTAVLDGTVAPEDRDTYLNIALNETKKMSELVNVMLNLSRLESGNTPLHPEEFDINALISESVLKCERKVMEKNISINIDFYTEPCFVLADKSLIGQVIVNLVDNAIKYSPENSPVTVATNPAGEKIAVSVCDKGEGIEPEEQLLIFEKFYTVDKARTPGKRKGTGVGLALVKMILAVHNQTITVSSKKGEGSAFTFTLDRK